MCALTGLAALTPQVLDFPMTGETPGNAALSANNGEQKPAISAWTQSQSKITKEGFRAHKTPPDW